MNNLLTFEEQLQMALLKYTETVQNLIFQETKRLSDLGLTGKEIELILLSKIKTIEEK